MGLLSVELGGGRKKTDDQIDHGVGYLFLKTIGDRVKKGETLIKVYHRPKHLEFLNNLQSNFIGKYLDISSGKSQRLPLIAKKWVSWSE